MSQQLQCTLVQIWNKREEFIALEWMFRATYFSKNTFVGLNSQQSFMVETQNMKTRAEEDRHKGQN